LEALTLLIKEVEREVIQLLSEDGSYEIARSFPGLCPILSEVVVLEVDRTNRFLNPRKFLSCDLCFWRNDLPWSFG